MKITILYDNRSWNKDLTSDWGFSCFIEASGVNILFDTGADGGILQKNMEQLQLSPSMVDMVFLSHDHWDHVDGLPFILQGNPHVKVYCPSSSELKNNSANLVRIGEKRELGDNIWTTGELDGCEHALVIGNNGGYTVVTGCSHPGLDLILEAASEVGPVKNIIGGFHEFSDLKVLKNLAKICPTHCTQYIREIEICYPEQFIEGGAGRILYL